MKFDIRKGNIVTAVKLSQSIPEFQNPADVAVYEKRLSGVPHLILVAYYKDEPVAFKVGYEREDYFYSWMGGVKPAYRGMKIATQLAHAQEQWAKNKGYKELVFKTRNQHKAMLIFALKNDFNIIGFTQKDEVLTNRILLKKVLR